MAKNILIISTFYPPVRHVATNRIYSFAKYLSLKGHRITVLTLDRGESSDYTDELKNVEIIRVKDLCLFRPANFGQRSSPYIHYLKCIYNQILYILKSDVFSGWLEAALPIAKKIIREKNIECIISSYPPLSPHNLAEKLKIENPELRWILDMRDAMSWSPRISWKNKKILEKKEKCFLSKADALLSVSKPQLEKFRENNVNLIPILEIRNGFDFPFTPCHSRPAKFNIIYAGTFYGKINPNHFLQALASTLGKEIDNVTVEIIGAVKPFAIPQELQFIVDIKPRMEYRELIKYIKEKAALLLLILPSDLEEGVYSGKIFDYLGSGRPILGLVPKNDVAGKLIIKADAGYVAENENIEEIKSVIVKAYQDWQNHTEFAPDAAVIKRHHRSAQVERLNKLIETLF